jgi:hypothetical protein
MSTGSACVASAATAMPDRCVRMSDDDYRRVALALTNCHQEQGGRATHARIRDMDDSAWNTYTQVLFHVGAMCRELQQELRAAEVGEALAETAEGLAGLRDSAELQLVQSAAIGSAVLRVAEAQEAFAERQAALAERGLAAVKNVADKVTEVGEAQERNAAKTFDALGAIFETTTAAREGVAEVGKAVVGIAASADEAQLQQGRLIVQQAELIRGQEKMLAANALILGALDRLAWLQTAIFGEILGIGAVVWYGVAAFVCAFATSVDRTAGARAPLLVGLVASLFAERAALRVALWAMGPGESGVMACSTVSSVCRLSFAAAAVGIALWTAAMHRDHRKAVLDKLALMEGIVASLGYCITARP